MSTLDEYRERIASEPLTPDQLGAVHGEFRRLGYGRYDRAERLEVTSELAWCGPIESTRDLTMGEAGRVIRALRDCPDLAALAELLGEPEPEPVPAPRRTLAEVVLAALVPILARRLEEERRKSSAGVL